MEEHYIKDVGKITYVYGVNLEEHKTVIEKQQKRIAELEKQLNQLKQQLAEKYEERLLDEQEFQHYCAFKYIEPEIKGCLDREREYKKQLAYKDMELLKFRKEKLYFELLISRLQWLHKRADDYRQEKERFGIADMSLDSVWGVLELQKNDLCEYEEMCALQEGIECIANSELLANIEHDLEIKVTRNENEIFKDIELIDNQINDLRGEKDAED